MTDCFNRCYVSFRTCLRRRVSCGLPGASQEFLSADPKKQKKFHQQGIRRVSPTEVTMPSGRKLQTDTTVSGKTQERTDIVSRGMHSGITVSLMKNTATLEGKLLTVCGCVSPTWS